MDQGEPNKWYKWFGKLICKSIKRNCSNDIRGIEIDERNTLKITQYADDTTVSLRDVQSLNNLFDLLTNFENCSGLRINQCKSELLWLGSLRFQKDTLLDVRLSEEPIYALGAYFSCNEHLVAKKNFLDRVDQLRRMLNIWSSRDKVIIKCYFSLVLKNLEIRNYFKQFNVNLSQEWRFPLYDVKFFVNVVHDKNIINRN